MSYRLYTVDRSGRLQLSRTFDCSDDEAAVEQAREAAAEGEAVELWDGGRLVGRLSKLGVFTSPTA
ncbi:hypothetical protein [Phenylobacterium sp.]|jgi:hypothetical protein|uniref:hypothetical protein n=1 Tax=Phenylobacterium sp. TaxID=1871053 RepID=UPI002F925CC0